MKRLFVLFMAVILGACDLRQRIVDAPEDIGGFIAARYPALLAEPGTEIYEYASVLDYGNGNTAEMYGGSGSDSDMEYSPVSDYAVYASARDYVLPDQTVVKEQTISEVARDYGTLTVLEKKSFVLNVREISVGKGDTAYSISKKYGMPVQRLAVLNNIAEPYALKIGQKLRVESAEIVTAKTEITKTGPKPAAGGAAPTVAAKEPVIKSNSAVKLPKLDARAGSKFAWPVKGRIISEFGPKNSGLSNDGINIGAPAGTSVLAADNGVVAYAGNELKGMGNLLIVQHAGGWMTVYAHLDSFIVRRGDKVRSGQKIGAVGETGRVSGPQLHFEVRKGAKAYDPRKQLR